MVSLKNEKIKRFLLSLCASTFIWGYVTNMHNPVQSKTLNNIPVTILNSDVLSAQNLALNYETLPTASVVVEGRFSDMGSVEPSDIEVIANLNELALKEGSNSVEVTMTSKNKNIKIVEGKTSYTVKLDIEKLVQKEFPVMINVIGSLPDNYITEDPVMSKDKVIGTGTKENLASIKYVVANVDLNHVTSDLKETVELKAVDELGLESNAIKLKDSTVDITIPVKYTKELPIKLDLTGSLPKGYFISEQSLNKQSITVVGNKETLDTLDFLLTDKINIANRYSDFDKKISIIYPDGVVPLSSTQSIYASFTVDNTKKVSDN